MAQQTKEDLTFETTATVKGAVTTFEHNMDEGSTELVHGTTKAKVNKGESFFVVYSKEDYNSGSEDNELPKIVGQVDGKGKPSTDWLDLGFVAKSARGFNNIGITLFANVNYGGTAPIEEPENFFRDADIADQFPKGIKSFIVQIGVWSLYDKDGKMISIGGVSQFKPGVAKQNIGDLGSNIASIKLNPNPGT